MNIYYFIFYVFVTYFRYNEFGTPSKVDIGASVGSVFTISLLFTLNVITIYPSIHRSFFYLITFFVTINFIIFFYKKRYLKIIDYYDNNKKKDLFYGYVLTILYTIISVIFLILL
jgi:hypothetical protein